MVTESPTIRHITQEGLFRARVYLREKQNGTKQIKEKTFTATVYSLSSEGTASKSFLLTPGSWCWFYRSIIA